MSTPAVIKIDGYKVAKLYKHWDGYPSSTLAWLEDFNKQFIEKRGEDLPYHFAQLVRSSALMGEKYRLDLSTETGWGVYGYNDNIDGTYEYTLNMDGSVSLNHQ